MNHPELTAPPAWVAVFDLDGTLTWRDTFVQFLAGFLRLHPARSMGLWRLPGALSRYLLLDRDRGRLKSQLIRMLMRGTTRSAVEGCAESFVNELQPKRRFRAAGLAMVEAHRAAGDHLVLLSASPDLYVPRIGRLLGFERTVCTEVRWRNDRVDGEFNTANRRGAEKSACLARLRELYPGMPVIAYGNSASDLDHLRQADRALLVNGSGAARTKAMKLGIPTATWA